MTEYSKKQNQMEDLLSKLANAENKLKMDSQKLKGQLLKEQITLMNALGFVLIAAGVILVSRFSKKSA